MITSKDVPIYMENYERVYHNGFAKQGKQFYNQQQDDFIEEENITFSKLQNVMQLMSDSIKY